MTQERQHKVLAIAVLDECIAEQRASCTEQLVGVLVGAQPERKLRESERLLNILARIRQEMAADVAAEKVEGN